MTELRTLNQLWNEGYYGGMSCCEYGCQKVIKQEVIKWLKYKNEVMNREHQDDGHTIFAMTYNAESWIKHFFGISDEDIKNG